MLAATSSISASSMSGAPKTRNLSRMARSALPPAAGADRVRRDGRVVRPILEDLPPRLGETLAAERLERDPRGAAGPLETIGVDQEVLDALGERRSRRRRAQPSVLTMDDDLGKRAGGKHDRRDTGLLGLDVDDAEGLALGGH